MAVPERIHEAKARLDRLRRAAMMERRGRSFGASVPFRDAPDVQRDASPLERYFDAHTEGPGIWKWRHYFDVYHRHLQRFRDRPVRLVEIGIYSGGSLGMWRDYFGAQCVVYGVDIEPACQAYEDENVRVLIGDQADPAFWGRFRSETAPVDVVIDDGGHQAHQQTATLEGLLGHINPGGVYICEDIHGEENAFAHYSSGLARNLHAYGPQTTGFQRTVESVHLYPFLAVIEFAEVPRGELVAPQHGRQWQPIAMKGAARPTV